MKGCAAHSEDGVARGHDAAPRIGKKISRSVRDHN